MSDIEAFFELGTIEPIDANFNLEENKNIDADFVMVSNPEFHNQLRGRDEEDCHPIDAITGLREALKNAGTQVIWREY